MHRDTISKALCVLEGHKLVMSKGDRWLSSIEGRELHPEWFGWIKDGRKINDLAYHYFVQPAETCLKLRFLLPNVDVHPA
jgi:hypothetical protein